MDELTDIYKRIEYLRNNGVKMKEIADRVDMAPSVLSALYSSVLPAYIDLLKTRTPDEALDEALALVNNVSKKRLLNNVGIGEAVASGDGTGRAERGGEWQLFYQVAGERGEGVCAGGV